MDPLTHPVSGNTVLLFGPQALSFDEDTFQNIRATVLEAEDHRWILDTIAELPSCLDIISKECPKLVTATTHRLLSDFNDWFRTGNIPDAAFILPNTLLNPLVIIAQLTQYTQYLESFHSGAGKEEDPYKSSKHNRETLGFCTGLLSALAVSSSKDKEHFQKYGAVALRIGMLIGLVVDAQDVSTNLGESTSLAVVWSSFEAGEEMARIIKSFPEVRIQPRFSVFVYS